jgi:hypothetical protein
MNINKIEQGINFLSEAGLNLYSVLDCASLPPDVVEVMQQEGIAIEQYSRLVLLGHGGRQLWQALEQFGRQTNDPIDYYSLEMAKVFIERYLDSPRSLTLYPSSRGIPLLRLGKLAGWSHASPLGIGINEQYGLWFAYRAAFLTTSPLPIRTYEQTQSPCDSCYDKPCISSCPAGAVAVASMNIFKCATFRVQENSVCQDRCLARIACPYMPQHRYTEEQIRYHYLLSMQTIKLYYK